MKSDFYFTIYLTENEHLIVEDMIRNKCNKHGYDVIYYRKFKNGHIPMFRECKINCRPNKGKQILEELGIDYGNYYSEIKNN